LQIQVLANRDSSPIKQQVKLSSIITRPNVTIEDVLLMGGKSNDLANSLNAEHEDIISQVEIQLKYEGYINREEGVANKMNRLEEVKIPPNTDFSKLVSLSTEAKEKLHELQPVTIGQASRISGVSPSDVSVLLVHLGR